MWSIAFPASLKSVEHAEGEKWPFSVTSDSKAKLRPFSVILVNDTIAVSCSSTYRTSLMLRLYPESSINVTEPLPSAGTDLSPIPSTLVTRH